MAQSLVANYVHITFSTKHRAPLIFEFVEKELYAYLGEICHRLECPPIKIGGHVDHVHILCLLSRKIPLMKLLEELKSHSSKWIKTKHPSLELFYWQDGYGTFSVKPNEVDRVIKYIENQKEHHRSKTFQKEFLQFLHQYNIGYDERYIWN